jgi:hypothetical protein
VNIFFWRGLYLSGRRSLTDDQSAAVAYRLMQRKVDIEKRERAKKARECGGKATPGQIEKRLEADVSPKRSEPKERTRATTAKTAKVSERKLRGIAGVAKAKPEMVQEIADGKVTMAQATRPGLYENHCLPIFRQKTAA